MEINKTTTVGEMAAGEPKSIKVFKEVGIDFCCDGKVCLTDALQKKNITQAQFTEKLEALKKEPDEAGTPDFLKMTPEALTEHIVNTHHAYLWKILPETYALFTKVIRVHGKNHPELFDAFKLFGTVKTDLEQHLTKEEEIVFPEIADIRKPEGRKLVEQLKVEHEDVGGLMDQIREVNHDYALPPDACMSYTNLYQTMREIEEDIHQHIHLENNILFKGII